MVLAGCGHGGEPTGTGSSALKHHHGHNQPAASYDLQLDTPSPLSVEEVTFDTTDGIKLGPKARVVRDGKMPSEIVSMVHGPVELEPRAEADDAWSRGKLLLDPHAVLHGSAMSKDIDLRPHATIEGQQIDQPAFDPVNTVHLAVHFPAGYVSDFRAAAHGKLAINPGRYGSIVVESHVTLQLSSGDYYAKSLSVAPGGKLAIDARHGPVYLAVRHRVVLRGDVTIRGVGPDFVLLGVGHEPLSLAGHFDGIVVAPHARVNVTTRHHDDCDDDDEGSDDAHDEHGKGMARAHGQHVDKGHDGEHGGSRLEKGDGRKDGRHSCDTRAGKHHHHACAGDSGAIFARAIHLGSRVVWKHAPANALIPKITPHQGLQVCAEAIRVANMGAPNVEVSYQELIARYCTMRGESTCSVVIAARANVDYTQAALQLARETLTPARYLAVVRNREHAVNKADDDPVFAAELCNGPDSDGDWVPDSRDKCPGTPELTATDDKGCPLTTLPKAPPADKVHQVLTTMHMSIKNNCAGGEVPPVSFPGAFYHPGQPGHGTYIFATRATGQPKGCPVWYEFGVEDIDPATKQSIRAYEVTFMDNEESTDLLGLGSPVPGGAIQFNPLPGDPGTRGFLAAEDGHSIVRFRVRVMNGAGVRGSWSAWKITTNEDCTHLGFQCF